MVSRRKTFPAANYTLCAKTQGEDKSGKKHVSFPAKAQRNTAVMSITAKNRLALITAGLLAHLPNSKSDFIYDSI